MIAACDTGREKNVSDKNVPWVVNVRERPFIQSTVFVNRVGRVN